MKNFLITIGLGLFLSTATASAATAGTVNGMKITVKEANKALKALTKGKMTWSKLPKEGRKQLIQMMAPSKLVAVAARKQLTAKEKQAALAGFWMQKKMSKIKISDKAAKNAYNKMKQAAKKAKSKAKIPPFTKAKNNIKMQLAQEKIVSKLMKKAKIRIK
jgi:hypothetical protein